MAQYKLTNKAVEDLNNIWEYTIENGQKNKRINIIIYCLVVFNK